MDKTSNNKDDIYAHPLAEVSGFAFDQKVVDVFPDMIKRSVPGYSTIIHMIGQLAEKYAQANSHCYDLGASLGAATLAMRHRIRAANCRIVSVDNSQQMINRCQQVIDADSSELPVTLLCDDINNVNIENASVVILNFTLQFIPIEQRETLLTNIYQGMVPGGVLVLSEKLYFEDQHHNELMTELHHYFKKTNGYSDLEIAQKRQSLENVLIPETVATHKQRLINAGFNNVDLWFQCFNFASLLAFK
ncbi:carboxy-S-adenosyl-L-methionine synthase CmoA [Teredinibacter sp. KSP-S5-2]|uniref:carboxy-S-adenosyl-L-methionine synthase CmoA n=1 Tax=Teredinibacter sp. KSP-S5-2 TaxID=3034506 RepID=UPI0029351587|nr:carboxy-S-adenosyl-L-methionine synthase CmoA [Teredinibacter sp. KSP-S5-2]WNO07723.1 carboxy-S-adenosyl-L-methionine synthase CmoA [Teredinibacter sp. KSP-S5-2]